MPKITYRIPTKEQYAFVEIVEEGEGAVYAEKIKETYDELISMFKNEKTPEIDFGTGTQTYTSNLLQGVTDKEFNSFLDTYVTTGKPPDGGMEVWERMSLSQKTVVNELKKVFKRMNHGRAET